MQEYIFSLTTDKKHLLDQETLRRSRFSVDVVLMKVAMLAQAVTADPAASTDPAADSSVVDLPVDPVKKAGPDALILWPWFGAQLVLGFVGYYIVKYDINDPWDASVAAFPVKPT